MKHRNTVKEKKYRQRVKKMFSGILMFAGIIVVITIVCHYSRTLWQNAVSYVDSPVSFRPETYSTNMPELKKELDPFFESLKSMVFASTETYTLSQKFLDGHPEIKNIKLDPNYLTGDVNIRIEPRKTVAAVKLDGKTAYLASDGTIMQRTTGQTPELPFEVHLSTTNISGHLPVFISKLSEKHDRFSLPLKELSCGAGEESCIMKLEDGTVVNWGTIFYTSRKIEELNHVLEVAGKLNKEPSKAKLNVDMRYSVSLGRSFYKTPDSAGSGNSGSIL